jgi:uncharacterized membrane protein
MTLLILGLILFLGAHSVRIFADDWRSATIARMGPGAWKGLYSVVSAIGLVLIVVGYGDSRTAPIDLWSPPVWTRHLASLFTLAAFVLLAAAYVPRNRIRVAIGHPMVVGVKLWAFAHLLANGRLADVILFGAFLAWAVLDFRSARQRDRVAGPTPRSPASIAGDAATLVVGLGVWALFAFHLHAAWFGVRPFGG